ncbi:hypothetical protein JCGZ_22546 [Jatropha curcas]|uniref:Uncharacterized protein n=1 Tax=Jatropha curcas TaxID=180498 RepID=A0A067K1Z8_JATCU|nr:hypothetical protein JCGZ_22546 [Jatropha curcas]
MAEVPLKAVVKRLSSLISTDRLTKCTNEAWIQIPGELSSLGYKHRSNPAEAQFASHRAGRSPATVR